MTHFLEADSIILEFGSKRVLQDIFIKCETGTIMGLLGRNGSGKTCLLNIIYGELEAINKSVRLDGKTIFKGFRNPKHFRYLPQYNFIPGNLKVKRVFKDFNLDFSKFITAFPGFEKHYQNRLGRLSGGEQRVLEVYAILASKTKFCLLDEPFSQIMPVHIELLKKVILTEKYTKGILITDHLYKHVMDICDDLYLLKDGKTFPITNTEDLDFFGYTR